MAADSVRGGAAPSFFIVKALVFDIDVAVMLLSLFFRGRCYWAALCCALSLALKVVLYVVGTRLPCRENSEASRCSRLDNPTSHF